MARIEARTLVEEATATLGISLADLVALSSVWVSPEIYGSLENVKGVWYADRRRANIGLHVDGKQVEFVGQVIDSATLDSNNYPNSAFKQALGVDRRDFVGFHICHIWPGTVHDPECFTNIANLVAIPAELSSLTDHHPHIVACLKFRAWELYQWKPRKEIAPVRPEGYPSKWRDPWPAHDAARRAASRRGRMLPMTADNVDETDDRATPAALSAPRPRHRSSDEATEAAIFAAFYLSKFEHDRLRLGNQGETMDRIAKAVRVKRNTLKNYRDYFDSHTGSGREGWKIALPQQLASHFPVLMRMDEATLRARVLAMLRG
jgi:hypothetical protein